MVNKKYPVEKPKLANATNELAGALLIGMNSAGDIPAGNLRDWLSALKEQLDLKQDAGQDTGAVEGSKYGVKEFHQATLSAGAIPERWMAPYDITIKWVTITAHGASTSADAIVDIETATSAAPDTWTTLYTTQAERPTLAQGVYGASATLPDILEIPQGDYLRIYVDAAGTGVTGVTLEIGYSLEDTTAVEEPVEPEVPPPADDYYTQMLSYAPAAYWRLAETTDVIAADETSNGLDGEYVNEPTLGVIGLPADSTAVSLESALNQYIVVPDDDLLDVGDVFSLAFKLKRNSLAASVNGVVGKDTDAFAVSLTSTGLINLRKWGSGNICQSTVGITDLLWHHVVVTKNGSAAKIWLDGVDVSGTVTNYTLTNNTSDIWWGLAQSSTGSDVYGDISLQDASILPIALSGAQIATLYDAIGTSGSPDSLAGAFTIASGDDDGRVNRSSSGTGGSAEYPPTGAYSISTTLTNNTVSKHWNETDGRWVVTVFLARWDTSSIPDDAYIESAVFRVKIQNNTNLSSGRYLTLGWRGWTPPMSGADWQETADTSASTGKLISTLAIGSTQEFALTDPDLNINRSGHTGIIACVSGGQPAPLEDHIVNLYTSEHATEIGPELEVTYTTPTSDWEETWR